MGSWTVGGHKHISVDSVALGKVSLTEPDNETLESAEQDQTVRIYKLILYYTLYKINP